MTKTTTPAEILDIAARHAAAAPALCAVEDAIGPQPHYQEHRDIGVLLDLLRRVAKAGPMFNDGYCEFCSSYEHLGPQAHAKDCPEPGLEALRHA